MHFRFRGSRPCVAPTASVAPTAILTGDVSIADGSVVGHYAVLTAESAPVTVGEGCVIMEHAVVRGAGEHAARIGDGVIVGPFVHISGATVGDHSMIATRASVFNGAAIGAGSVVAIGATVHVGTQLPPESLVPIGYIAVGESGEILPPTEAPHAHEVVAAAGFTKTVFGHDTAGWTQRDSLAWMSSTYSRALRHHGFGDTEAP